MIIRPRRFYGFSFVEVLAAVVLMGILVTAVVPLQRRLLARQNALEDAQVAQQLLAERLQKRQTLQAGESAISDYPEWLLRIEELQPDQSLLVQAVPRRWYKLSVARRSDQAVISSTWTVVIP